jgi:peptidyl-prolyl cis-trans isomerase C
LLKRARAGDDFAKLAKEFSEDTASKDNGGEYPPFPRGRMVAEFDAAAFALKPKEVSDIVTTMYGYHIIKSLERLPAQKVELAKVSTEVRDYLKGQALQKLLPDYMAKLKKEASVEILDERLKPSENADSRGSPAAHSPSSSSAPAGKTQ